jgi:hypothetical protein
VDVDNVGGSAAVSAGASSSSGAAVEVVAEEVVQPEGRTVPGTGSRAIRPCRSDICVDSLS